MFTGGTIWILTHTHFKTHTHTRTHIPYTPIEWDAHSQDYHDPDPRDHTPRMKLVKEPARCESVSRSVFEVTSTKRNAEKGALLFLFAGVGGKGLYHRRAAI